VNKVFKPIILSILFSTCYTTLNATHIIGAEITYRRISDEFLTFEFTLSGYTSTQSPVRFGDGFINFGDGRKVQIDLEASSFEDGVFLGPDKQYEWYRITITHTYVARINREAGLCSSRAENNITV